MDHILSESPLEHDSAYPGWPCSVHSFIELEKAVAHVIRLQFSVIVFFFSVLALGETRYELSSLMGRASTKGVKLLDGQGHSPIFCLWVDMSSCYLACGPNYGGGNDILTLLQKSPCMHCHTRPCSHHQPHLQAETPDASDKCLGQSLPVTAPFSRSWGFLLS